VHTPDTGPPSADSSQQTADSGQQIGDSRQEAADSRQEGAESRENMVDSPIPTTPEWDALAHKLPEVPPACLLFPVFI
jgi:hypothetical protein